MRTRRWTAPPLRDGTGQATITSRQAQVLDGIAQGKSYAEIAADLFVTEHTVRTHVKRMLRRLGARSGTHAVGLAASGQVEVHVQVDRFLAPPVRLR